MNFRTIAWLLALASTVFLTQCNRKAHTGSQSAVPTLDALDASQADSLATEIVEDLPPTDEQYPLISYQRTNCYGICPAFEFQVCEDGSCWFSGTEDVKWLGQYEGKLDDLSLQALISRIDQLQPGKLFNHYPANGPLLKDLPASVFVFHFGSVQKEVTMNYDVPVALEGFQEYLD
ncbi:MAG: hypothetical protein KDC44_05855, partial [Phaeodactylibacter sp.]|nr:hypothetical protein [Phaeodactylibacter sp.]